MTVAEHNQPADRLLYSCALRIISALAYPPIAPYHMAMPLEVGSLPVAG